MEIALSGISFVRRLVPENGKATFGHNIGYLA